MQRAFGVWAPGGRDRSPARAVQRAPAREPHVSQVLALQRAAGNRAVGQLLARAGPKPATKKKPAQGLPIDVRELEKQLRQSKQQAMKEAQDAAIASLRARGAGTDAENKERALAHAWQASYAMTGKSTGETWKRGAEDLWAGWSGNKGYKRAKVQSVLGGTFLRMYLAGKTDPDTIEAAGEEIAAAADFAKLQKNLEAFLSKKWFSADTAKAEAELKTASQTYFSWRLTKQGKGIAFREELNPVIGGVSDVKVAKAMILFESPDPKGRKLDYHLEITLKDTYDFQNTREGEYEKYRKKLAGLLSAGQYADFWEAYGREAFGVRPQTSLTQATVFASYMYAVESKGWTPGSLPWEVTLPMKGTLIVPIPPKPKFKAKAKAKTKPKVKTR